VEVIEITGSKESTILRHINEALDEYEKQGGAIENLVIVELRLEESIDFHVMDAETLLNDIVARPGLPVEQEKLLKHVCTLGNSPTGTVRHVILSQEEIPMVCLFHREVSALDSTRKVN
jgi:hypothetical protein